MSQGHPIRAVDFFGVAVFQSVCMLLIVWVETGRDFGWRDTVFSVVAGTVLTSGLFISIRYRQNAGKPPIRIPSRFLLRLLFYWCSFVFIFMIPLVDLCLLHRANVGYWTAKALVTSLWMAFGFAVMNLWSSSKDEASPVKFDLGVKGEEKQ